MRLLLDGLQEILTTALYLTDNESYTAGRFRSVGVYVCDKVLELRHTIKLILESEICDFQKFSSPDKILAFAGLSPSTYQSGKFISKNATMESPPSNWRILFRFYLTLYSQSPIYLAFLICSWKKKLTITGGASKGLCKSSRLRTYSRLFFAA